MDIRFFFSTDFIYKKLFIELFNAASLSFPGILYIYIYIHRHINIYIDRFNALWGYCDKWLEFFWM